MNRACPWLIGGGVGEDFPEDQPFGGLELSPRALELPKKEFLSGPAGVFWPLNNGDRGVALGRTAELGQRVMRKKKSSSDSMFQDEEDEM